jgi:hypothetical protein
MAIVDNNQLVVFVINYDLIGARVVGLTSALYRHTIATDMKELPP